MTSVPAQSGVDSVGRQVSVGRVVRAPKTAELVAGHLRSQIVRGELKEGDTLPPEVGLMAQFGVSRPTLREAFRILETESLISVRRGSRGGARVIAPDLSVAARYVGLLLQVRETTITDVYEARMVVEPACARLLAKRGTAADFAELRAAIQDLADAIETQAGDTAAAAHWWEYAVRFHRLLMEKSGNRTLAVQGGVLQDIVTTHLALSVTRGVNNPAFIGNFRLSVLSYRKLVDLAEARDAEAAAEHWRVHLEASGKATARPDLRSVVDLFR